MKTRILSQNHTSALKTALSVLKSDGMVVFPTDTVYGLGALAFSTTAIEKLYAAKERSTNKAIAVLIGEPEQLNLVAGAVSPAAQRLAQHFWPGALTLVVEKHPGLPALLSPLPTIGVRLPDHEFARSLLRLAGPLATTSANLSGGPNPRYAEEVLAQLEGRVELVIDGGEVAGGIPSTVVDCTQDEIKILREGAVTEIEIRDVLRLK